MKSPHRSQQGTARLAGRISRRSLSSCCTCSSRSRPVANRAISSDSLVPKVAGSEALLPKLAGRRHASPAVELLRPTPRAELGEELSDAGQGCSAAAVGQRCSRAEKLPLPPQLLWWPRADAIRSGQTTPVTAGSGRIPGRSGHVDIDGSCGSCSCSGHTKCSSTMGARSLAEPSRRELWLQRRSALPSALAPHQL